MLQYLSILLLGLPANSCFPEKAFIAVMQIEGNPEFAFTMNGPKLIIMLAFMALVLWKLLECICLWDNVQMAQ